LGYPTWGSEAFRRRVKRARMKKREAKGRRGLGKIYGYIFEYTTVYTEDIPYILYNHDYRHSCNL
jgi:hypothetical protein